MPNCKDCGKEIDKEQPKILKFNTDEFGDIHPSYNPEFYMGTGVFCKECASKQNIIGDHW
jgi:hypothetical protein